MNQFMNEQQTAATVGLSRATESQLKDLRNLVVSIGTKQLEYSLPVRDGCVDLSDSALVELAVSVALQGLTERGAETSDDKSALVTTGIPDLDAMLWPKGPRIMPRLLVMYGNCVVPVAQALSGKFFIVTEKTPIAQIELLFGKVPICLTARYYGLVTESIKMLSDVFVSISCGKDEETVIDLSPGSQVIATVLKNRDSSITKAKAIRIGEKR